jgi:hypothetical protein
MRHTLFIVAAGLLFAASAALAVQDRVDICHFPPGNPSAAHVITVGAAAVPAHLAHGDAFLSDECICECLGQFVECESGCEPGSTCDIACGNDLEDCRVSCTE